MMSFTEQTHPENVVQIGNWKSGVSCSVFSNRSSPAPSPRAFPRPRDIWSELMQHFATLQRLLLTLEIRSAIHHCPSIRATPPLLLHNTPQTTNNEREAKQSHRSRNETLPALSNRGFAT
jgi:hypothetical protein